MASSPLIFLIFLLMSSIACSNSADALGEDNKNMTHLHFYFHEIYVGLPNPTSFVVVPSVVAGAPPSGFGEIRVFDNALREGPEPSSKLVGRAQGMVVQSSLGVEQAILSTINFVLTDEGSRYNGSSLALFGRADAALTVNERSIVGGSGQFRLAQGYALSKIVNYTSLSVVVEFDMYVLKV